MTLHWIDYAIILIPFAVVLVVSWNTRRYMKSVADFMSVSRCGGRYLICTASGEAGFGAISAVALFEVFCKAGFTINWWNALLVYPVVYLITLTGYVIYRYRETRAMTLAQFFKALPNVKRNPLDDGSVVNHHNLGETESSNGEVFDRVGVADENPPPRS